MLSTRPVSWKEVGTLSSHGTTEYCFLSPNNNKLREFGKIKQKDKCSLQVEVKNKKWSPQPQMFCLLRPPGSPTVDRGGKGVTKTALHFLWVSLGALSSALAEMQFPSIHLRGQRAPLQGICENPFSSWFPDKGIYTHILSLEHSSR